MIKQLLNESLLLNVASLMDQMMTSIPLGKNYNKLPHRTPTDDAPHAWQTVNISFCKVEANETILDAPHVWK